MTSRILFITHRVPYPPDRGDRIRTWNVLKFLSARADVDLICLADEAVSEESRQTLQQVTRQLAIIPHSGRRRYVHGLWSLLTGSSITEGMFRCPELGRVLRTWAQETVYDATLTSSSGIADYTSPPFVRGNPCRWVDLIDVDSQKWVDYSQSSSWPMSWLYALEGRRLRKTEIRLSEECDRLLVVSKAECSLFRTFCDTDRIYAVGNGVDAEFFAPASGGCRVASVQSAWTEESGTANPVCVFVGVMNYLPNVDAVCWFADHVWPAVIQQFPTARFAIVGKSPSAEVLSLANRPGIEVTGPVPDVRPWIHQATCAVIPLRIARGIQNKVLEAMACGLPVICSPTPLQSLAVESGTHLLQADSSDEWVSAVTRVFNDAHLRSELGTAASEWVRLHHSWDASLELLNELTDPMETATASEQGVNR